MITIIRVISAILTGLFITVHPAFTQMLVKVKDIANTPEKYYNQTVILEGFVEETQHTEGLFAGYYILKCHYGGIMNVYCKVLPAPGSNYQVTAIIKPGKETKSFIAEEIKRKKPGSWIGVIILGSLIATMGIVLVFGHKTNRQQARHL